MLYQCFCTVVKEARYEHAFRREIKARGDEETASSNSGDLHAQDGSQLASAAKQGVWKLRGGEMVSSHWA